VNVGRYWRTGKVEDSGRQIRVRPGLIGQQANQMLKRYGAKIGLDPASISAAKLGLIYAWYNSHLECDVPQIDERTF
jgi:D-lactate dehydrogenase